MSVCKLSLASKSGVGNTENQRNNNYNKVKSPNIVTPKSKMADPNF